MSFSNTHTQLSHPHPPPKNNTTNNNRWVSLGPSPPWPHSPRTAAPSSTPPSPVRTLSLSLPPSLLLCVSIYNPSHILTHSHSHPPIPIPPPKKNPTTHTLFSLHNIHIPKTRTHSHPTPQPHSLHSLSLTQPNNRPPGGPGRLPPPLPPRPAPDPALLHPRPRRLGRQRAQVMFVYYICTYIYITCIYMVAVVAKPAALVSYVPSSMCIYSIFFVCGSAWIGSFIRRKRFSFKLKQPPYFFSTLQPQQHTPNNSGAAADAIAHLSSQKEAVMGSIDMPLVPSSLIHQVIIIGKRGLRVDFIIYVCACVYTCGWGCVCTFFIN